MTAWAAVDATVHSQALVDDSATLGAGTAVWQFAHVMAGVRTGIHCSIGGAAEIGRDCVLGDNVRIGYGVFLPNRTRVGHRVFIGPRATLCDDKHPRVNNPRYKASPPVIEDDASIGAGAVLLPGVVVGRGALVGAGAVVTRDVAPYTVVMGNPARARV